MSEANEFIIPTQVSEINFLTNSECVLKIKRAPHLNYFTQSVPIPGISAPPVTVPTPHATIPIHGNRPLFDPLNITFKIDQGMNNYVEILSWITGLTKPESFEQAQRFSTPKNVASSKLPMYDDASLFVLSNSKRAVLEIRFTKIVPTSISTISFDTTRTDGGFAQATASFVYDTYGVYRVSDNRRLA